MKKNVALVLSGGGARGCAHIGVIRILEQHGYIITSVAGTSMGALIGGIYASGQLPEFEKWISSLDRLEVLSLTDFSISKKGLFKGEKIINRIKEIVPSRKIEDLPIPFCAVATDILEGTETVFRQGDLFGAIRASIAIPTVFQPHSIGDRYFVDGGITNPIPVNRVYRSADDLLVVVNVSAPVPPLRTHGESGQKPEGQYAELIESIREKLNRLRPEKKNHDDISIFNLSNKSIGTMMRRISELTLEKHKPDILISISRQSFSTWDFYKAGEIIREGEEAAVETLKRMHMT